MLNHHTLTTLRTLKLSGMASAFEEQQSQTTMQSLSFEERFGMLLERESTHRNNKRLERLLKLAKLKHGSACIEDIDYRAGRSDRVASHPCAAVTGLDRGTICCSPVRPAAARLGWPVPSAIRLADLACQSSICVCPDCLRN